ncbi:MAG: carbohydrate-binding protein [Bacillales bacterium]|jgi:hypothetical protein|nr:carbohydrate-binding protein [Bacillales bacterium]
MKKIKKLNVFILIFVLILSACNVIEKSTIVDTTSTSEDIHVTTEMNVEKLACNENNKKIMHTLKLEYAQMVCQLTGQTSINKTYGNYRFGASKGGTDLGIPVFDGEKMNIFFGDTFDGYGKIWRSNIVGFSTDFKLDDGLLFDSFLLENQYTNTVKAVVEGRHEPNVRDESVGNIESDGREVTKIPTGGIHINDTTYMFYMSVRYWGDPGAWAVNYNGVVKSNDGGLTWSDVPTLKWTESEAPHFGQIFPIEDKDNTEMIYLYGIPGGRHGGVKLARVLKQDIEKMSEYEYFNGFMGEVPIWVKGSLGLETIKTSEDSFIFGPKVGEISVMYNPYLGKWLLTYLSETRQAIVFRTAENHWGPWSNEEIVVTNSDYTQIYGAFMHEKYTEDNGKTVYFIMSQFVPYEAYVFKMVLK